MSTHHCSCSTLLFYIPRSYKPLSHRQPPILDHATIISFPPLNSATATSGPRILNSSLDKKPIIIRRKDGFEKRWLWKCERCRGVWGYELQDPEGGSGDSGGGGEEENVGEAGRRVLYMLEEGLVETDALERSLS